jgi:DNA-binding beta-propeller fold protein YncE
MKAIRIILFLALLAAVTPGFSQRGAMGYKVVKEIPVNGDGGWDYLTVDPNMNRLFISHSDLVQVIDLNTDKVVAAIPNVKGVHGIALVTESGKGYISAGKMDTVVVIDCNNFSVMKMIKAGQNPDAIIYDPFSKRVFAFNGRSHDATVIDAVSDNVVGTLSLPGKPEYAVSDNNGKMYVNIEDKSTIVKFDTKTLKVEAEWPLNPGKEPSGLAMDRKNNRLFSACSGSKQMVVMDASSGKVIGTYPIGEGCDGLAFIPETRDILTSNGEGTLTVIRQKDADDYEVVQTLETRKSARTITVNPQTKTVYLSSADVKMEDGKRKVTPGSFKVLVVSKPPRVMAP